MTNNPDQLKGEYDELQAQTDEFNLEFQKALESGDLEHAKGLKAQLEQKKAELEDKLLPFDPERDITKEDWEKIEAELVGSKGNPTLDHFADFASAVKILNPEINLPLDDGTIRGLFSELKDLYDGNRWDDFESLAGNIKILDPNANLEFGENDFLRMDTELESLRSDERWQLFTIQALQMKNLFPDEDLDLSPADWEGMEKQLHEFKKDGDWSNFSSQAAHMKILNPEIEFTEEINWREIREAAEEDRKKEYWPEFVYHCMNMKILAAKHVQVTDKGLEVRMR